MGKIAWVAGATGAIGNQLVKLLNQSPEYDKVVAFVRKPVTNNWETFSKVKQWVVDYEQLEVPQGEAAQVDDLFCALGSTTKKTPDKKAYYQIDVQYPLNFAALGSQHSANFYGLVSSHGASQKALSNYLKMKGGLEAKLQEQPYSHIAIARPSLLIAKRKEYRLVEHLSGFVMSQLPGNYKAINTVDVATSLIKSANNGHSGLEILQSKTMHSK